ncbi:isocitrate/isopropylmalate dehydrogenase family protein [Thetidibacter halocola]|uniref:isocitrate/isopropylmalate dehydrogenase family protein n=1 Tax=Thetidibacter halocola TaxID=2827239 RepID=UPI002010E4D3|nr:isocitrate/isopropylmalate dehydrogenase family protein [Thetidibacter halocola]
MKRIAILAGDGIGPEISQATQRVLQAVSDHHSLGLTFHPVTVGFDALRKHGSTFPDAAMQEIQTCDGIVLGPVSHNAYPPRDDGGLNPSGELRKRLDLYGNIRPARSRAGIPPRAGVPLDLIVVRENTEGFYADRNMVQGPGEMLVTEDVAIAMRKITRPACMRIAREAFRIAKGRSGRVTAVHKANVMRTSCGLFLECCRQIAAENPEIAYQEQLVDAMCALLVRAPDQHDVIVTTNMFGDILSDLASELSGSLGLAASLNAGEDRAMAQAQHGSAPDIAGQDIANPASLIGSAAMLLDWMGRRLQDKALGTAAVAIEAALEAVLSVPEQRTRDLGGKNGTAAFTDAVIAELGRGGA